MIGILTSTTTDVPSSILDVFGPKFPIMIGAFIVIYVVCTILYMRYKKNTTKRYLDAHPTACKVIINNKFNVITTGTLTVITIDDEIPVMFNEGIKPGFYAAPGEHIIEATYEATRPGVVHKSVTDVYGPSKQKITVEAGKKYELGFNEKEKNFHFSEI